MGVVLSLLDKLSNVMSGAGTSIDKTMAARYVLTHTDLAEVEAAYRSSWLMRKIVDIPPLDMTREWRAWQAGDKHIEAIEKAERRLQIQHKAKRALTLARLWGGGMLVLGIKGDADTMQPLRPVQKDGLAFVHVLSRHQVTIGDQITDIASPWYGEPEYYQLNDGNRLKLHPSRVIPFVGQKAPEGTIQIDSWFWGDPLLLSIRQALQNADMAQDGFAALIDEAKVDILKIPDMMANVGTEEYQQRLLQRLMSAQMGKSTWRALMIDAEEEWDQRQVNWAGMPDVLNSYLQIVAGAADIPVTRLLGQSPRGMQSNGDGEERDYHAMIAARQDEALQPALDRLDEVLIPSALGSRPSDIWWKFNPLDKLTPKDAAEVEAKRANAVKTYADTGLFHDEALREMAKTAIIESGQWPGSEKAFEDAPDEPEEQDEDDLLTAEERAEKVVKATGLADAAPRPLYVQRKLLNADEVIAWAKGQGFTTTLEPSDMHVTVLYSRAAVDPMKMGEPWHSESDGGLIIKAGGPRAIEQFDGGAVVLQFVSWALSSRHADMVQAGGSHDFPEYQPHITLTYQAPDGIDLDAIKPYAGELRFGPELFEPLDLDWKAKVKEN
jgi:phage-related protein (TIGR01555 family)